MAELLDMYSTVDEIHASVEEVETYIRGIQQFESEGGGPFKAKVIKAPNHTTQKENTRLVFFYFLWDKKLGPLAFRWGYINLHELETHNLTFSVFLDTDGIKALCGGDDAMFHRSLQYYQGLITELRTALLRVFDKPKKQKHTARKPWDQLKSETQRTYREAWAIYLVMCKEYAGYVLDGQTRTAKPTISDWKVRVLQKVRKSGKAWNVTERTLETVRSYGEAGDIPKRNKK